MLYRQEKLAYHNTNTIQEAADILNESVYLTEEESIMNVTTIPIIENNRLNKYIINFSDLEEFVEDHGIDYIDAVQLIAENNNINPFDISISMSEMQVISNLNIIDEMFDIVVTPSNPYEAISLLVESSVQIALDEEDYSYIENMDKYILESDLLLEILDTEKGREQFIKAFNRRYGDDSNSDDEEASEQRKKVEKLEGLVEKLRNSVTLMRRDPNVNKHDLAARERQLDEKKKKLEELKGRGHSRVLRRAADDNTLGLNTDKETRVRYRAMSRKIEKENYDRPRRAERIKRDNERDSEKNPHFIKRTIAKIKYSSPVQAIAKAVKFLREKLNKIRIKAVHTKPEERNILQKLIVVISGAI